MTAPGGRLPTSVRVAAVVVGVVAVVGTLLTWHTDFPGGVGSGGHPAWTSGAWPALGATVVVAGAAIALVAAFALRGRVAVVAVGAGAVVTLAGVVTLLAERYRPVNTEPVTVAIARFTVGPIRSGEPAPDAASWLVAAALGAVVVAAVAVPHRAGRRGVRAGVALAGVGAVLVLVGASVLPWSVGLSTSASVTLWQSGRNAVVGVVLLLVAAAVLALILLRPRRGAAVAAALLAAAGLGVLLPQRLPDPWGARVGGWYAYRPLDSFEIPPAWRFHAATTLVLLGAAAVLVAAVVLARRTAPRPALEA